MGKKKTRQNSNCIVAPDPSESSDAAAVAVKPGSKTVCPHLNKSVDTNALRKNFRGNGHLANRECFECKKQNISSATEDVWLCLRCGVCCCGPEKNNHTLNHFETPRSDSHGLVIKLETLVIWCHECRLEIPHESSQKLYSCIDFIKQQRDRLVLSASKKSSSGSVPVNGTEKNNFLTTASKLGSAVGSSPKVKGLSNLGNTCFFNSVLQCLAQTPGLVNALREMLVPGQKFTLPLSGDEPLSGELDKGGPVSESLFELLTDMAKSDDMTSVLVPRKLLAALRRKCPVFEGGDQHDAHELLRHLLDVVRTEDLRRYQRVILQINGLSTKVNPVDVAEDKKKWIKEVNRKVSEEMPICPDQIFKGMLVSQLQCQTCFHTSDCLESFLDLSVPVTSEKPVPPVVTRRKNQLACKNEPSERELVDGQPQQSSCMSKKERRQMQKRARNKKKYQLKEEGQGEPSITEEDKKESSDADVEDNDEIGLEDRKIDVLESGYSSEKPASSRTSPVTECRGEAEDSACASPSSASDTLMITNGVANLQLEDQCMQSVEKQCLLSRRSESGLGSSIVSVQESNLSAFGASELTHSMDSSDSIKGNPSSTSRDLSTESLPKIGSFSQDDSVSSDHDDTLTVRTCGTLTEGSFIDISSAGKDDLIDNPYDVSSRNNESKTKLRSYHNEGLDVNSELSCINSRNDCCSPSFEYNKQIARSSPVENSCYQSLDSNLLSMSLESYKTEFLLSQGEDSVVDTNLPISTSTDVLNETYEVKKDILLSREINEGDLHSNKSNCQEMGFVLVGGVSRSNDNLELSVGFTKNKAEIVAPGSGDSKPINGTLSSGNDNDPDLSEEISAEFYKNRHITLAPRYECPEGECSVLSCLNHFTAIEMMAGNNKVGCEACTQRQNKGSSKDKEPKTVYRVSTKRLLISSPPPVLILHLKRFQVQRFSFRKLSCHVGFPAVLDLAPFCSASVQKQLPPNQTRILYSLYGVVAHSGTLRSGHYIAYVKVRSGKSEEGKPCSGTWYYVSDSHAREVSEDNVLNSQAYLLFYERFL